ncbi:hypothetical protein F5884DRAFT_901543 [Xylogone sp. PMI_703]|nr:hypothetical protein F5884DRAFT_901543 [Xylogone sp. PMI_703]
MEYTSQYIGESISYFADHGILFCTQHQSAIPFLELKNHLRLNRDHKLPPAERRQVFEAAQAKGSLLQRTLADLPIPQHSSEPLPFLLIIESVRCHDCGYLRGTRKDDRVMKTHVNKHHIERTNGNIRGPSLPPASKTPHELIMETLEAEEDIKLEEKTKQNQQKDNTKGLDKSTPWLKHHTKWPRRFKDRPLNILAITKKTPSTSPNTQDKSLVTEEHQSVRIQ